MKRIAAGMALLMALGVCLCGCGEPADDKGGDKTQGVPSTPNGTVPEDTTPWLDDSRYVLKTYLTPFWSGNKVYNETLWVAGDYEGDPIVAPLMYKPDRVLSVRSYDLQTTYKENVDYTWAKGDAALVFPEDTSVPHMTHEEYYSDRQNGAVDLTNDAGEHLYFAEGTDISSKQIVVTYSHSNTKEWTLPIDESAKFPRTMEKLEKGESVNVVFYGDSITVGANSSGYIGYGPRAESYPQMVTSYMKARFPDATVNYINTAEGGTTSTWGNDGKMGHALDNLDGGAHFQTRVLDKDPDLLFIAFGMNDSAGVPLYRQNISSMISRVRAAHPDVEIVLVSSMMANPEVRGFYTGFYEGFENALKELAEENENIGVATVYSSAESMLKAGKRFRDVTGNDVNHPNDFLSRLYAQTILYTLFGEDYIEHI